MKVRREVLPNGLTLLLEPDPEAQTVAAGYFIAAGGCDEAPDELGISHFLEHLMFKGSARLSALALNERLDDLGGHSNAFTSEEHTVYHAACLPERLDELLETLTELLRPALRPADIETERLVILEEIAMYNEQPSQRVLDTLRERYWGQHPLGRPVLGTVQTVGGLTPAALERYFSRHYGAGRVTLVLTGRFDPAQVLAWAQRELADWGAGEAVARPTVAASAPAQTVALSGSALSSRAHLALALPGLSTTHPLREAATVLAELIGGENSLLYWALLDTGLADSADFAHLDYVGAGCFEGGLTCDPARLEQVQGIFLEVLATAGQAMTPAMVGRVARKMAVGTLLRAESPQGRLFGLGLEYLALGQVLSAEEQVERYAAVTFQDVQEVLRLCPLTAPTIVTMQAD